MRASERVRASEKEGEEREGGRERGERGRDRERQRQGEKALEREEEREERDTRLSKAVKHCAVSCHRITFTQIRSVPFLGEKDTQSYADKNKNKSHH